MPRQQKMDAVALLKADHRKVEELFAAFEKASGDGRKRKLAEQICMELTVHTKIEEDVFYPACEGKVEEDLLKEAYVEHVGWNPGTILPSYARYPRYPQAKTHIFRFPDSETLGRFKL